MTNCGYELGTVERDDPHTERRRDSVRGRTSLGATRHPRASVTVPFGPRRGVRAAGRGPGFGPGVGRGPGAGPGRGASRLELQTGQKPSFFNNNFLLNKNKKTLHKKRLCAANSTKVWQKRF